MSIALHDRELAADAYMAFNVPTDDPASEVANSESELVPVRFQFPPKVTGDGRRADWVETGVFSNEPVAYIRSASPRSLTLSITYIVENEQKGADTWSVVDVKEQVSLIRGYFHRFVAPKERQRNTIVLLRLWAIGGSAPLSFRMTNCDVKYSENLFTPRALADLSSQLPSWRFAYPIRTDITVDLQAWTQQQSPGVEARQSLDGQSKLLPPDWF